MSARCLVRAAQAKPMTINGSVHNSQPLGRARAVMIEVIYSGRQGVHLAWVDMAEAQCAWWHARHPVETAAGIR